MDEWLTFRVTLAIRLSLQVYGEASYVEWANKWLSGEDRSKKFAYAAFDDAHDDAAASAAYAAYAYAYADADAADAVTSSVRTSIRLGAKLEKEVRFL